MDSIILHHAPWIVPISHSVLHDGAIATSKGRILEAGTFSVLQKKYAGAKIQQHNASVLLPPLVNAHIHLELSHLSLPQVHKEVTGFTDWIGKLLAAREKEGAIGENVENEARGILRRQHEQGVICLGDIGNTDLGVKLAHEFPGILFHFHEVLGRSAKSRKSIHTKITAAADSKMFTVHAPYSTHSELIQSLKKRAKELDHPFPIHTAEPPSEKEFLSAAAGELYDFLVERKFIDSTFKAPGGIDRPGSVHYLHKLGVLDEKTLCVHCVHVSEDEIRILAESKTKICLCPGSNLYLNIGHAPLKEFLDHGILPALGTDSCASNPELSIWREMSLLRQFNPDVQPEQILAMATLGGARVFGIESDYGTLDKEKKAVFLAVSLPDIIVNEDEMIHYLTSTPSLQPNWIGAA